MEECSRQKARRSSESRDRALCGQHCGTTAGSTAGEGQSAPLLRAGCPHRVSATARLVRPPRASPGPKSPALGTVVHPAPWASHQACVLPVHALRLLHHTGETAGTGRGAGKVLQHLCSLGCCLRSATDGAPLASSPPQRPRPGPAPSFPAQKAQPAASGHLHSLVTTPQASEPSALHCPPQYTALTRSPAARHPLAAPSAPR